MLTDGPFPGRNITYPTSSEKVWSKDSISSSSNNVLLIFNTHVSFFCKIVTKSLLGMYNNLIIITLGQCAQ